MKASDFLITSRQRFAEWSAYFGPKLTRVVSWLVFALLAVAMLFDPVRDTKQISNAAFAVSLALASVAFSYGRALKENSPIRSEVIFAGESLIGGAFMFLIASIVKHTSSDVPRYLTAIFEWLMLNPNKRFNTAMMELITMLFSFVAFLFFFIGLVYTHQGIFMLSGVAAHRMKAHPLFGDPFVTAEVYAQRLAHLDEGPGKGIETNANMPDSADPKQG